MFVEDPARRDRGLQVFALEAEVRRLTRQVVSLSTQQARDRDRARQFLERVVIELRADPSRSLHDAVRHVRRTDAGGYEAYARFVQDPKGPPTLSGVDEAEPIEPDDGEDAFLKLVRAEMAASGCDYRTASDAMAKRHPHAYERYRAATLSGGTRRREAR
jgi:hypothetical protein